MKHRMKARFKKLINQSRYDDIRNSVLSYFRNNTGKDSVSDVEIENVIHIEQTDAGIISFDVIVSCDMEMPSSSKKDIFSKNG